MRIRGLWAFGNHTTVFRKFYVILAIALDRKKNMHGFGVSSFVHSIDLAHTSFFCTANNGFNVEIDELAVHRAVFIFRI